MRTPLYSFIKAISSFLTHLPGNEELEIKKALQIKLNFISERNSQRRE